MLKQAKHPLMHPSPCFLVRLFSEVLDKRQQRLVYFSLHLNSTLKNANPENEAQYKQQESVSSTGLRGTRHTVERAYLC